MQKTFCENIRIVKNTDKPHNTTELETEVESFVF